MTVDDPAALPEAEAPLEDDARFEQLDEVHEAEATCPHCGEGVTVLVDPGGGPLQSYVEDCPVCCRPWHVRAGYGPGGASVELDPAY